MLMSQDSSVPRGICPGWGRRTAIIMADMPRPDGGKGKDQACNVGGDNKVAQHEDDGYLQPSRDGHV